MTLFTKSTIKVNKKRYPINKTIDTKQFIQEFDIVKSLVSQWLTVEKKLIPDELSIVDTVLHNLATFNLKHIDSYQSQTQLTRLFNDVPNQQLKDRLDNLVILIHLTTSEEVVNVCKGRFYNTLKTEFGIQSNILTWLDKTYKNIWILPIIQNIYQISLFV